MTSFNGIWNGCEAALLEVRRVLNDGGSFGMTFWGAHESLGPIPYFLKVIELSPASHQTATMTQGDTRLVAEEMLLGSGFSCREQGTVEVTNEWPDMATAVRALASAGPSVPAIEAVGYERFCSELSDALAPLHDPSTGIRITSEFGWVTAQDAAGS